MTDLGTLLQHLTRKGVRLRLDADTLRWQAPPGAVTSADLEWIRTMRHELIALLARRQPSADNYPRLAPRSSGQPVPLSFQQKWLWKAMEFSPPGAFNVACTLSLNGPLNVAGIRAAVDAVICRHEALRVRIVGDKSSPRQEIAAPLASSVEIIEMYHCSEAVTRRKLAEMVQGSVDPSSGPVFKASLLHLGENAYVLLLVLDHLVSDGLSVTVLLNELRAYYKHALEPTHPTPPLTPIQYPDYAIWQQTSDLSWSRRHAPYWRTLLADAKPLPLGHDYSTTGCARYETLEFTLPTPLAIQLRKNSAEQRTSISMFILAVLVVALSEWTNSDDVVIPFNVQGRHLPELASTIGYFAHILHLRFKLDDNDTFEAFLRRVVAQYALAYTHDDFGRIVDQSPDFSRRLWVQWNPPFSEVQPDHSWHGEVRAGPVEFLTTDDARVNPNFYVDFAVVMTESAESLGCLCQYRNDFIDKNTVQLFRDIFLRLCGRFSDDPVLDIRQR